MKGIIMEINRSEAVVLSDDGSFSKIKNKNYAVGQVVYYKQNKEKILASACAAAAVFIIACGGFSYYTPTTYVSIDVNPSIAFSLNMFDRVLSAQPVDDDAKPIVGELHLKNKTIDEALQQTINDLIDKGYITEDENSGVVIATSNPSDVKAEALAERLQGKAKETIENKGKSAAVDAEPVGKDLVNQAKALGVTPGKLNLVNKLKESSDNPDDVDVNEWLQKPVKDINKTIKENKAVANNNNRKTDSTTVQSETSEKSGGSGTEDTKYRDDSQVYNAENSDHQKDSHNVEDTTALPPGSTSQVYAGKGNDGKQSDNHKDTNPNAQNKEAINTTEATTMTTIKKVTEKTTAAKTQPSKSNGNSHSKN